VEQVVACLEAQLARGLLFRAEADAVELPAGGVVARQGRAEPARGGLREGGQHRAQPLRLFGGVAQEAADPVLAGVVADVLVRPAGEPLLQQEGAVRVGERRNGQVG